jgi:hypothetical protein
MAESQRALLDKADMGFMPEGVPRLSSGFDVRSLAELPLAVASGRATVDLASRHIDDHQPEETHERNLTVPRGFESILARINQLRQTAIGRAAIIVGLSAPALVACGRASHETVVSQPPAAVAAQGGQAGAAEGTPNRVIVGDPACYEDYATLPAEKQAACDEAFDNFTLEQVTSLSGLDQARWAYTYHHKLTGGEDGARLNWTRALETDQDAVSVADDWVTGYSQDVMWLAWMKQKDDKKDIANDPRTLAAFFGVGTTADSLPAKDAQWLAKEIPAGTMDINDYMRRVITSVELYGAAKTVHSVRQDDGGYSLSFTSLHHSGTMQNFSVRFRPYLHLDKGAFRPVTDNDEASMLFGKPVLGMNEQPNA